MTGNEYQRLASRTIPEKFTRQDKEYHALHGLVGEIGELNLDDVMQMNIDKLKARYPDGFDTEHSLHRAEGDI